MRDMQIGEMQSNTDRLNAFSDGVVAVIITLMVLELKAPSVSSFAALVPLWPDAVSYAISYLFVAIIWIVCARVWGTLLRQGGFSSK